jgi:hypothetical protein
MPPSTFSFHKFHFQFSNHNDYRWLQSTREVECPISFSLEDMETSMIGLPLQSMNDLHRQGLMLNSIGDCQLRLPWKSIISAFQHVQLCQADLQRAEKSKWWTFRVLPIWQFLISVFVRFSRKPRALLLAFQYPDVLTSLHPPPPEIVAGVSICFRLVSTQMIGGPARSLHSEWVNNQPHRYEKESLD